MPSLTALFGRFIAKESFVHSLDPRAKLTGAFAMMVIILCATTPAALAVSAVFVCIAYAAARISLRQAFDALWPLLIIVAITALLNVLFVSGGTVYFQFGIIVVSEAGIRAAVFMGIRLLLLLLAVSLLTLTTSTLAITAALEAVFKPLARIGVPVHELSMMLGIALRFLPQLASELTIVYRAQESRAAALTFNPFRGGLHHLTSLLVPLFTSSLRHADTLAAAMDARCYHGELGRTQLHPFAFTSRDAIALAVVVIMAVGVIAADIW